MNRNGASLFIGKRVGDRTKLGVDESNVGLKRQHLETTLKLFGYDGRVGRILGRAHASDCQQRDQGRWCVRATEIDDLTRAYHHRTVLFRFI